MLYYLHIVKWMLRETRDMVTERAAESRNVSGELDQRILIVGY